MLKDTFPYYTTYRLHFNDGTNDIIHVLVDETLQDSVVEHCEEQGWHVDDVKQIFVVEHIRQDADGNEVK